MSGYDADAWVEADPVTSIADDADGWVEGEGVCISDEVTSSYNGNSCQSNSRGGWDKDSGDRPSFSSGNQRPPRGRTTSYHNSSNSHENVGGGGFGGWKDRNQEDRGSWGQDRPREDRGSWGQDKPREDRSSWGQDRPSRGGRSFGDSSRGGSRRNDGEGAPLTISIESRDVGRLIGKGGSKIRELQDTSQARIKVDRDDGGNEATVKIFGSESARDKAYELINDLINETQDNASFGFGRGRPWGNKPSGGRGGGSKVPDVAPANTQFVDWGKAAEYYAAGQKERWAKCPKLQKNFYQEDPTITAMHQDDVVLYRKESNNIMVSWMDSTIKKPLPNPVLTFEQAFSNYPEIMEELQKNEFVTPTPIQAQAWPVLLQGLDLIGIAQTGTGKTLAFLLPALIHTEFQPVARDKRGGPNVLILAPTRELAQQIEKEANKLNYRDIKAVCVYGGGSRRDQINLVNQGVQIVIATPGRLNDLVMAGVIDINSITYLVLDEADRMLDMGFEPQIKKLLLDIRPDRQTVMTSATWPEGVRRLASQYMTEPIQVWVGTLDLAAVHTVEQHIEIIHQDQKRDRLYEFIKQMGPEDKAIIFVGRKCDVDDLSSDLALMNIPIQSIHGDREQNDREQALEDLKMGDVRILVATDVASRGIDIKDVTHIVNYDFPRNVEEYVHRVGRTGRAGRTGQAITLFTREDWSHARELIAILEESSQHIPGELFGMADRFDAMKERRDAEKAEFGGRGGRGGGFRRGGGGRRGNGNFFI